MADLRQQFKRTRAMQHGGRTPEMKRFARVRDQGHLHVLDHGHRAEGRRHLEGAADTEPPDLARRQAGNVFALAQYLAAIGRQLAVDHVEAGRFSGAVRADHGEEFALADLEADIANGVHAAEGFA
jgi:hypothetical protein